jgi:hypothetical protein
MRIDNSYSMFSEGKSSAFDSHEPVKIESLSSSDRPVEYFLAETIDGLYVPYALRTPTDTGKFPFVFLAYGNGGMGFEWLQDRMHNFAYITEKFLQAGYACAWGRYRSEVELAYNTGGRLVIDRRQGMDLLNRGPLEYEDEISIIKHVKQDRRIQANRIGHVGVSHAGEMLFKIGSQYKNVIQAGVACEPANHEFLDLNPDNTVTINPETNLRNIEEMQMRNTAAVRARINEPLALARIAEIDFPILVMGRNDDHLQGIFRLSYDLLVESGKNTEWVSWDHPLHGYIFPVRGEDGDVEVDSIQEKAIDGLIAFLDRYLK